MKNIRTIITQDAEVDDRNSLRHFLLYANEVEVQGIIQTSSKFHWRGVPGAVKPEKAAGGDFAELFEDNSGPFDQPYRWPGTDWMIRQIDDYAKDYPNLCKHADGYPTPDYLRSITKVGNVGYEGEMEQPTEGSELIRQRILDKDERTLYIQVWGGCNTIARALKDIQTEYDQTPEWWTLHEKITKKVVFLACGEQDRTYREYIAEEWPGIAFVKTLQMESYAYPWFVMPEGESKDCLRAAFMKREILNGKSALASGYCTWLDGNVYPGEAMEDQFGSNPEIGYTWFGAKIFGLPCPDKYDFLSEGDSPTYFALFDWGLRYLEDYSYGGFSGRNHPVEGEVNSKGKPLNLWDVSKDHYMDRDGKLSLQDSMWLYVADIQRDFAARVAWCAADTYEEGEHAPKLVVREGIDIPVTAGQTLTLHAEAESTDHGSVEVCWRIYEDASAECAKDVIIHPVLSEDPEGRILEKNTYQVLGNALELTIPANALPGEKIHVIVRAQNNAYYRLTHYQQIILMVK